MTLTHYSHTAWRGRVPRRSLRRAQHDEVVGVLMLVVGVALVVAPWVRPTAARDAHVNESVVGVIVVLLAARRLTAGAGWRADVATLALGGWLAASPFLLALGDTRVALTRPLDVALGAALAALALVSLWLLRTARTAPGSRPRG